MRTVTSQSTHTHPQSPPHVPGTCGWEGYKVMYVCLAYKKPHPGISQGGGINCCRVAALSKAPCLLKTPKQTNRRPSDYQTQTAGPGTAGCMRRFPLTWVERVGGSSPSSPGSNLVTDDGWTYQNIHYVLVETPRSIWRTSW